MPNSSCSPDPSYFSTPDFLKLSLHLISAISTPIYLLGLYCILFKTPKPMISVKWYLLTLHAWIILFDYCVGVLGVPMLLVPAPAGFSNGVLRYLGVPDSIQGITVNIIMGYMCITNISIYENRFFILCQFPGKDLWTYGRWIWLFSHYLAVITFYTPAFFLIPDQLEARKLIFQRLPCLPDYLYQEPIFVMTLDPTYHVTAAATIIFVLFLEFSILLFLLFRNSQKQRNSPAISQKTYQMHKQFLHALVIQMTIPYVQIGIPVSYLFICVFLNYYNQAATNVFLVFTATHGLVSTVTMILVHRPYRLAVMKTPLTRRKSTMISITNHVL